MATTPHKHSVKTTTKALHKTARPEPELSPADLAAMVPVEGLPQFKAVNLDKRYVPARLPTGTVMEVWGEALIRTPDGSVRELVSGDEIKKGDVILTAQDGIVQMEADGSRFARQPFGADMQGPLAQVYALDELDATGAGPTGGPPESMSSAMRIDRVVEQVSGQEFQFGDTSDLLGAVPTLALSDVAPALDAGNQRTVLDLQNILVPESGVIIASGVQAAAVAGTPGYAVFTVHLDTPSIETIQLALKLTPGTATLGNAAQGGDFGSTTEAFQGLQVSVDDGKTWVGANSVTVPIGVTQALVRVPVTDDTIDEFDETFTLTATRTSPGAEAVIMVADATIVDNDPAPSVSSNDVSVNESSGTASVTLTLSSASGKPISVDWSTADGVGPSGATAGQDYTAGSGTVTFAPGETSKTISVPILSDKLVEPTEQFTINLSNGVNVDITAAHAVTIIDDDHAPTLVHQSPPPQDEDVVQTGNVLAGAHDADGDPITVVTVTVDPITIGNTTIPGQTAAAGQPINIAGIGTVIIDPNGNYTFTPAANYDGPVPPIHYTASDSANQVTETIQLAINPVNDAPVILPTIADTPVVSELGLANALAAAGNPVVATGTVSIQDPDNTTFTIRLEAPTTPVTVGGLALGWSGTGTTGNPLVGSIDGKDYLRASMANDGTYKVELLGAIDNVVNPAGGSKTVDFKYFVSDGFVADNIHNRLVEVPGTLAVNVIDDTPHLAAQQPTATVARADTNLVIMLDTSGSMALADGFNGTGSRLDSAVLSIKSMLDEYAKQGNVQVQLITFSTTAHPSTNQWLDVTAAKAELDAVQADNGTTNYAPAMTAAINAVTLSPASANPVAQNVAYFFSDGLPTTSVTADQQTQWTTFLNDHSMKSVAIGLGSSNNSVLGVLNALSPIAYDGALHVDTDPAIVNSVTDLTHQLAGTIPVQLHGFLAGTATSGVAGGADTAHISSVTVDDGKPAHTFDGAHAGTGSGIDPISNVLTVTTNKGGTLTIDMDDGSYGYQPPTAIAQPYSESINFTVTDRDGNSAPSSLVINVPATTATGQQVHVGTVSTLSTDSTVGESLHATPLADVFSWTLADAGAPGSPSVTHITGFGTASASQGGDLLDLRDLLQGELAGSQGTVGNLGHYLDFSVTGSGAQASTTLQISSHGGFDPAVGASGTGVVDKTIVLDGVDLRGSLGLDAHAANQQIIESLLQHGKLVVDGSTA